MSLGLHLYPSTLTNESRLVRIAGSLQKAGAADECRLVGIAGVGLPGTDTVSPGVSAVRLGKVSESTCKPRKALNRLSWYGSVLRSFRSAELDYVAAHSVWVLPLAAMLARLRRSQLLYLPHELESESARTRGVMQRIARQLEARIIPHCSVVAVVNDSIADWYLAHYGVRPLSVRNIPVRSDSAVIVRETLSIPVDEMLCVHTGNLVGSRSIPEILDAFEGRAGWHVAFLGDGSLGELVREYAERNPNIHWLPPVGPSEVVEAIRGCDVSLVLIQPDCLSYELSSPNKLFEALAAGVPPLCSDLIEARRHLPGLEEDLVVSSVAQLPAFLDRHTRTSIDALKGRLTPLPTWEDECQPLTVAVTSQRKSRDQ